MRVSEYMVLYTNEVGYPTDTVFVQALNAQHAADIIRGDNIKILAVAKVCKNWK